MNEPTVYQQWCAALIEAHARYFIHLTSLLPSDEYQRWLVSHAQRQTSLGWMQIRRDNAQRFERVFRMTLWAESMIAATQMQLAEQDK